MKLNPVTNLVIFIILLILSASQANAACETGQTQCSSDSSFIELCFSDVWANHFRECLQGCTTLSGAAICSEEIGAGCCQHHWWSIKSGCYPTTSGCGLGLWDTFHQQSCYDLDICLKERLQQIDVTIEPITSSQFKISVTYEKAVNVIVEGGPQRIIVAMGFTGLKSIGATPELPAGSYLVSVYDGLTRIYKKTINSQGKLGPEESFIFHKVENGQTLTKIAEFYRQKGGRFEHITAELLAAYNQISLNEIIYIDTFLKIPNIDITLEVTKLARSLNAQTINSRPAPWYNIENLMSNEEFLNYMSVESDDIEAYLLAQNFWWAYTPLPSGSKLGRYLVQMAQKEMINPLLLFSKMQSEHSAVEQPHSEEEMVKLMGCQELNPIWRGSEKQIECGAERLSHWFEYAYMFELLGLDIPPWTISQDEANPILFQVNPQNAATYSLLRYTPWTWVKSSTAGGNTEFIQVYRRYRANLLGVNQKV